MTVLAKLKAANAARWAAMHVHPQRIAEIDRTARKLLAPEAKRRFAWVSARTGVPWPVIAVISEREGGGSFDRYLGNGQPLDRRTTQVPAGRGPFTGADAWERGALDALIDCAPRAASWSDWSIGGALTLLEQYNGLGYAGMGKASPYIWAATDQYVRGKYVADHDYRPDIVDDQIGCAALLARMAALDPEATIGVTPAKRPDATATTVPPQASVPTVKPAPKEPPKPAPAAPGGLWDKIRRLFHSADYRV